MWYDVLMTKTTLHTGFYRLDTKSIDMAIAHLYEHMLIMQFAEVMKQHGHSNYGWGWLDGETFDDVVFLEYGIYSTEILELLQEFMCSSSKIDINSIDIAIRQIEAEDRSIANIPSRTTLINKLRAIDSLPWTDLETDDSAASINTEIYDNEQVSLLLHLRPSAKDFRHITYTLTLGSLAPDEAALACRLLPLMHDICTDELTGMGAYRNRWTLLKRHNPTDSFVCCAI